MCNELYDHRQWLWTFLDHEGVEPTNNGSERALRHAVIWRKLSFGTQSASGSRFVETMLTVIETCRQQHRNVFAFVTTAVEAHLAGQPGPYSSPPGERLPSAFSISAPIKILMSASPYSLNSFLRHCSTAQIRVNFKPEARGAARSPLDASMPTPAPDCNEAETIVKNGSLSGTAISAFSARLISVPQRLRNCHFGKQTTEKPSRR